MISIAKNHVRISDRQQSVLDAEQQKLNSEVRLLRYVYMGEFNHETLAAEFEASGKRMKIVKANVIAEALVYKGRCPTGGSYGARRDAALSKFNQMDKRERKMSALMERSTQVEPDLTDVEWTSLRWEMNWLNEVRESYDEWDWKTDDTRR